MKVTRRDLLFWGMGATAGLIATPVPWKILDDTSIWSQNWPWIPQPVRGPVEVKQSSCTLCPNGCGLRVKMASGWPVGLSGEKTHPNSRGALCPLGFGAHQLLWHPRRMRTVRHRGNASTWAEAQAAFQKLQRGTGCHRRWLSGTLGFKLVQDFCAKTGRQLSSRLRSGISRTLALSGVDRNSCARSRVRP